MAPGDIGKFTDIATVGIRSEPEHDSIMWRCEWLVEKWNLDKVRYATRKFGPHEAGSLLMRGIGLQPDEVVEVAGNLGLNAGITEALKLIGGITATAFNAANAQIGTGTGTTAAAVTDTVATMTAAVWKNMNASYPQVSAQTISWQADFGTSDANQAWNEWGVRNGATANILLNRKIQSLGTKPNTQTWTMTGSITLG